MQLRIIIGGCLLVSSCFVLMNFTQPAKISVQADGKFIELKTDQQTVGEALKECHVEIGPNDIVKPDTTANIHDGLDIRIYRVQKKTKEQSYSIPYPILIQYNNSMPKGKEVLTQAGKEGVRSLQTDMLFIDDVMIGLKETKKTVEKPSPKIISVGTKKVIQPISMTAKVKNIIHMGATAYSRHVQSCGKWAKWGRTRSGLKAKYGVVAVDPTVVPLGTKLYVEGYGHAIAADTGSAIKGKRIDLCFDTHQEAVRYGCKQIKVYVLE
ncbi:G5 domain-containing protein [bacterium]|nr:G5 domain-containing protein [bacterium]MBU1752975.1 G5 domain-containing protein [bacterium]